MNKMNKTKLNIIFIVNLIGRFLLFFIRIEFELRNCETHKLSDKWIKIDLMLLFSYSQDLNS